MAPLSILPRILPGGNKCSKVLVGVWFLDSGFRKGLFFSPEGVKDYPGQTLIFTNSLRPTLTQHKN